MTTIQWDQVGERVYESGVDRGVLYLPDGGAVPWNGLVSVVEKSPITEGSPVYFDGVKYGAVSSLGDYSATMKAFTYPDEFLQFEGIIGAGNGLFLANQKQARFGLSYRTKISNDIEGDALGYKIHVVYNLTAVPSQKTFSTDMGNTATQFEWSISAVPEKIPGYRATAHIIFDTRTMGALLLEDIERTLYGDEFNDPKLPAISTFIKFISDWVIIRITDNFDGTWTATGPDDLFEMLDATTFQIIQANAEYVDADTYNVSSSTY